MLKDITRFLEEVQGELKKVVWPTREKAVKLTISVIVISVAAALYLSFLDSVFAEVVEIILRKPF